MMRERGAGHFHAPPDLVDAASQRSGTDQQAEDFQAAFLSERVELFDVLYHYRSSIIEIRYRQESRLAHRYARESLTEVARRLITGSGMAPPDEPPWKRLRRTAQKRATFAVSLRQHYWRQGCC